MQEYAIDVPESVFPMTELLTVRAVDVDADADFGSVRYAVRGEGEDTFVVDPVEGHLMVRRTLINFSFNLHVSMMSQLHMIVQWKSPNSHLRRLTSKIFQFALVFHNYLNDLKVS